MASDANPTDMAVTIAPHHPLREILTIGANSNHLRTLVDVLQSNGRNLVPFVGAGLSADYEYATWKAFLLKLGERAGIKQKIARRIKAGQYEEAADDLFTRMAHTAFHDAVDEEYGDYKLVGKTIAGPHAHLSKLAFGPVVTTNFDRVLEKAFEQAQSKFVHEVWGAKGLLTWNAFQRNERILIKLHGDSMDDTDRILTLDDYQSHYSSANGQTIDAAKPLPKLLRMMLGSRPFLFVGCSLNSDRTLSVIKYVADEYPDVRHWAILEMPATKRELIVRNLFLSTHNIRPIWYPHGRHEFVGHTLEYLATKIDQVSPLIRTGASVGEMIPNSQIDNSPITEIFVSYSDSGDDGQLVKHLFKYLAQLKNEKIIRSWHEHSMRDFNSLKGGEGMEWINQVHQSSNSLRIILLLVSVDLLSCDCCYDIEMKRAVERHNKGKDRVIPVILRTCDWQETPFGKLQPLPTNGKPIKSWRDRDNALLNVARGIRATIAEATYLQSRY